MTRRGGKDYRVGGCEKGFSHQHHSRKSIRPDPYSVSVLQSPQADTMWDMSGDTTPDAERMHVQLLRRAGPFKRSGMASSITNWCLEAAREGLRRARPHLSQRELDLLFVEFNYGRELAMHVRRYLDKRP